MKHNERYCILSNGGYTMKKAAGNIVVALFYL